MDGGFYAFFWLLQWKEWFQFIQFQLPGPTALREVNWSTFDAVSQVDLGNSSSEFLLVDLEYQ